MDIQTLTLQRIKLINIPNLPTEMIQEILSRLPITSLLEYRYVSKPWKSLINNPQMSKLHYNKTKSFPNQIPTNLLLLSSHAQQSTLYYIADIDSCKKAISLTKLPFKSWLPNFSIVGSCNGFICLADLSGSYRSLFISNPVSGDWFKLPDVADFGEIKGELFGFGYDRQNDVYKVLRKRFDKTQKTSKVEIITVGSNSWRTIESCALMKMIVGGKARSRAFVNGCLHWLVVFQTSIVSILSFNFENEEFGLVPIVSPLRYTDHRNCYLGLLGGCLTLMVDTLKHEVEVWVMKDYGVEDSWVRECCIPRGRKYRKSELRPLELQSNGNILLEGDGKALFSYDPKTSSRKYLRVSNLPATFVPFPHAGTLVKLKDVISIEES